jgi:YLP motif-containing protein 1
LKEIEKLSSNWDPTPATYISLDIRSLLQDAAIEDVGGFAMSLRGGHSALFQVEMEEGSKDDKKEGEEEDEEPIEVGVLCDRSFMSCLIIQKPSSYHSLS